MSHHLAGIHLQFIMLALFPAILKDIDAHSPIHLEELIDEGPFLSDIDHQFPPSILVTEVDLGSVSPTCLFQHDLHHFGTDLPECL